MKNKLEAIRKRGPSQEFDPAVEAELDMEIGEEEDMPMDEMDMDMEEEPVGGGADAVISMLAGLSPEDLSLVQEELDTLMAEAGDVEEEDEGMDYEDMDEEEELPEEDME